MKYPQDQTRSASGNSPFRVLSKSELGRVSLCPEGCLHVDTRTVSVRLTEPQFHVLVEMLKNAALELTSVGKSSVH